MDLKFEMEDNFFSLFARGESAGFNTALIETMLNAVPVGLQFLRPIRDHQNNIIDFEYVPLKNEAPAGNTRKIFLNSYPGNKHLFEKLKHLAETGVAFQTGYSPGTDGQQTTLNFIKFADGILISGNDTDGKGKKNNNITEQQKTGTAINIPVEAKPTEEAGEPDKTLIERNEELEALNEELKTINSVASLEYKETIQKLYTNLEYIVTNNARVLNDASKANVRRAQSAIQRMKLLNDDINGFLQLHDIGIHKSIINPNPILENIISKIKGKLEQTNANIESAELPDLFADPLLLSLLFTRILDNSIKFRKLIAPPLIRVKHSQADEMNGVPMARKNTPYTIISVSDNGIGLDEENADKIFELFFTIHDKTRYKGSGIGLAACKKIMHMHGGFITAEGSPAQGTTITCYFPATI